VISKGPSLFKRNIGRQINLVCSPGEKVRRLKKPLINIATLVSNRLKKEDEKEGEKKGWRNFEKKKSDGEVPSIIQGGPKIGAIRNAT